MSHTLGIDVGTSETKGVLVDAAGTIVASAARPHRMIVPRPGWAEHRAIEDWWVGVAAVSRSLIASSGLDPRAIAAVGCSAIGPCMLPVDASGEPLCNAVLYGVDTRASREIDDLTTSMGADVILEHGGNVLTSQSVGPKILWLRRNRPDLFARTRTIMSATPFLVHRLTGRAVIDHYSASGFSPLYSADRQAWDASLGGDIIDPDRLPELAWTTEIAGGVTPAAALETGLAPGTKVIVGTIDAAAEALSAGVLDPGDMMIMYGSTIFVVMPTPSRVRDARLWSAPWLFPGQHASLAGLATSGTLTRWFRDEFARDLDPATAYDGLVREAAASPPGARGLVVLPSFSGERTPVHDPHALGCLFGLDLTHTRADLYRGVLEGIAYGVGRIFETYDAAGQIPRRVLAVGGGTRNAVWLQAVSDVCGIEQQVPRVATGAAYGDAFLAALAIGTATPSDLRRWNPIDRMILPDLSATGVYRRQFDLAKRLYGATRSLMAELGA